MYARRNCTCENRDKRESACTSAEIVHAENVTSRKLHVRPQELYMRKLRQAEKCMYPDRNSTCEKHDKRESACKPAGIVRAEVVASVKAHASQWG